MCIRDSIVIALMASASMGCDYLCLLLAENYVLCGGDRELITQGFAKYPPKLKALADLVYIFAYRPWSLREDNRPLAVLLREAEMKWSISELTQALIIIALYHGLSCFCLAYGLVPELDFLKEKVVAEPEPTIPRTMDKAFEADLIERMRKCSLEDQEKSYEAPEPKHHATEETPDTPNKSSIFEEVKSNLIEKYLGKKIGVFESFTYRTFKILRDTV
eukprot:TRINITY_DN13620_c0_g1_i2.p1 TRINITY_DN13620_c0_g1~~TRINITY_DN13620_c0_g1_i2.p1  ORF type:complete len:218 (+),score=53.25 TRINITY_DN13620_c0_g1_i2:64-717(+)